MLKTKKHADFIIRHARAVLLLAMILPISASAMSAGQRIVYEAVDASDADTMRLVLHFEMHVNYLWHFPHVLNTQFLIAVQPVNGLASYDLNMREHIQVPPSLSSIISDLYYDGTQKNNRFIVLVTTRKVSIDIKPERDGRSILIEFESVSPKPAPDCSGKATDGKG